MEVLSNEKRTPVSVCSLFAFTSRNHLPSLAFAVTFTTIAGIVKPAGAIFFGKIFSALTQFAAGTSNVHSTLDDVSIWCIGLSALGASLWLFQGLFLSLWMVFGELQAKTIREQMFAGLIEKELVWYDLLEDGISSLMVRIQTQIRELQLAVSQPLGFLLYEFISSIAAIGVAFFFSWKLTFVIIATVPVACIILYFISIRLSPAIEAQKAELAKASKGANSAISAIDTVKAFNAQEQEVWEYHIIIKKATTYYLRQAALSALQLGIMKFIVILLFVQGFWYGLVLVTQGTDPGHILTAFYACLNAIQAVEVVLPQWLVLAKGISAGYTLSSIISKAQNGQKITGCRPLRTSQTCHGDIEMKNISFSYPSNPSQLVVKNSSFFFPSGETTYVVGKSGSGKSTLANLIMRYYEPLEGEIMIDGNPVKSLDPVWLRENITLVQQQSVIFNESILRNIMFGKLDASDGEIRKSCQDSELEGIIKTLPEGLSTMIGSYGKSMSGGQNQRICIARAQLRDTPILILDEATSALDRETKNKLMQAIRRWRKNKTTIIITHDLGHISDDEYVYVIEDGVVVQEGYKGSLQKKLCGPFTTNLRDSSEYEELVKPLPPLPSSVGRRSFEEYLAPRSNRFSRAHDLSDEIPQGNSSSGNTQHISPGPLLDTTTVVDIPLTKPAIQLQGRDVHPACATTVSDDKKNPTLSVNVRQLSINTNIGTHDDGREADPIPLETLHKVKNENKGDLVIRPVSLSRIFSTIWPALLWKDRCFLVSGFIAAILVAAATPAFSFAFANLLNAFNLREDQENEARKWALVLLGIALTDGTASFCSRYCLERSGDAWINELRMEALRRILDQPKSWFEEEGHSCNHLIECLDRNAEEMRNLVGRFAGNCFTALWILGITLVWSLVISWKLTLVTLSCGPIVFIVTRAFNWVSGKWENKCNKVSDAASNVFTEVFFNIRTIRAFTLERYFEEKYSKATSDTYRIGLSRAAYSGLLFGCSNMMSLCVAALVFYYGTVIVTSGQRNVQQMFSVMNLLLFGISNSSSMLYLVPQINSSRATAAFMIYLANLQSTTHESIGTERLASPFPIRLRSLSFAYPSQPQTLALDDVSMGFDANSCTAIVGPSGSGKSTITSILMGLYPPTSARHSFRTCPEVTFATSPVESIHLNSLRALMAIVPQTPFLFPTTIAANITFGLPEMSPYNNPQAIIEAARAAEIHEFIESLPEGYGTLIGEGGQGLSGGQRQRIAIARALVRKPHLLILDEPTSALDIENAAAVRQMIRQFMESGKERGVAVMLITHDSEMMKIADRIVCLQEGRVVEQGTYVGLGAKHGGVFATLVREMENTGQAGEERDIGDKGQNSIS